MNFLNYVRRSHRLLDKDIINTPLQLNKRLSDKYNSKIYFKREDLQITRSFKLRGSLNKLKNIDPNLLSKSNGIICASAGNHAQGVAMTCNHLKINSDIFIPEQTPIQKVERIKYFGGDYCNLYKIGKNFDSCLNQALKFGTDNSKSFVHPYNDINTIIGQSTIALEIFDKIKPDYIIGTIGGGGMMSGISKYSNDFCQKNLRPNARWRVLY